MFIEQILKESWEEGRVEGVLTVAKTMLENGFTVEEIKTATKLSKRKIQALKKSLAVLPSYPAYKLLSRPDGFR